jgi:hypothetical protein
MYEWTIRNILKSNNYINVLKKKKLNLLKRHAAARLSFAIEELDKWRNKKINIMFTDESYIRGNV